MASQEVIQALEELYNELEKLRPVNAYMEATAATINATKQLTEKTNAFVEDVRAKNMEYSRQLSNTIQNEVNDIKTQIEALLNDLTLNTTALQEINSLHKVLNEDQKASIESLRALNLPGKMQELIANIELHLEELLNKQNAFLEKMAEHLKNNSNQMVSILDGHLTQQREVQLHISAQNEQQQIMLKRLWYTLILVGLLALLGCGAGTLAFLAAIDIIQF